MLAQLFSASRRFSVPPFSAYPLHVFCAFRVTSNHIIMPKNIKHWKTIIQFIITVLTAVVSTFLTQSCMNL